MKKKKKTKYYFKIAFSSCPNCQKTIERIGVYDNGSTLGYVGGSCELCGYEKKVGWEDIEELEKQLTF